MQSTIIKKAMAIKRSASKSKKKEKGYYLDFDETIKILKSRNPESDVNLRSTADEIGYTVMGLREMRKKAPKSVVMVFKYLKDNNLEITDVLKEY